MRHVLHIDRAWAVGAALIALAGLARGCGTKFELPTENRTNRTIPGASTYQMIKTRTDLDGIRDILLTPSGELYLLIQKNGAGRVLEFPPGLDAPLSTTFSGLQNPAALCFGANRVYVLDQGDTAAARTNFECVYTADCGTLLGFSRPITNLDAYWHVRSFELDGGPPAGGFTDTTFAWVNGIAADAQGRVYVSGVINYCDVDPFDPRRKTLESRFRIFRYQRGIAGGSVIGDGWQRDTGYEIAEGTGIGFTLDPRGMQWAPIGGAALYFADLGNNEVQKFADPSSFATSFKIDIGGSGTDSVRLVSPMDVAVDSAGYVYVADTGNHRVLRYAPDNAFVQRVDIEADAFQQRLDQPVAVAANNDQVYVADPARNEVVRYRRRK